MPSDCDSQNIVRTDQHFETVDLHNVDAMATGNPQVVLHHQLARHWTLSQLQRPVGPDAPLAH